MNQLSKEEIKKLVLELPDKFQHPTTTSHEFKNQLIDTKDKRVRFYHIYLIMFLL